MVVSNPDLARRPVFTRRRVTDGIAAIVVAAALIASGIRSLNTHHDPFSTRQGQQERAGFVDGCRQSPQAGLVDCSCVFSHLTSSPQYDTPENFLNLQVDLATVFRTHRAEDMPPAYLTAVKACLISPTDPH